MLRLLVALALLSIAACKDGPPAPAQAATVKETKTQAAPLQVPRPDPNQELVMRVRRALEEAGKIDAAAIDVTAADGVVSLFGTAGTKDERTRAGQVAAKVDGVKSVENKLVIVRGS
jgi:hyperosmotically inducible periplasmic protein